MQSGDPFYDAVNRLGPRLLTALAAFEEVRELLHPPRIGSLRDALQPIRDNLIPAVEAVEAITVAADLVDFRKVLLDAAGAMRAALDNFCAPSQPQEAIPRVLHAMHLHCQAQASLFQLRRVLGPVNLYFLESGVHARLDRLDPELPEGIDVGIMHVREPSRERGGFDLYVPESYDGSRPWPLVMALHGGSGNGEDFLWTWVREARSRQFILAAPTSLGSTWSMMGEDIDAPVLGRIVDYIATNWRVDRERVLLTGLSDGATYTLLCGLQQNAPFTALAPISGVLHPFNFDNGNIERARGKRIYLVHGELDWMFPIAVARMAYEELRDAGADIVFRPLPDLSHTYPRTENDRILSWFDPALALPPADK
jgi:phospholipase/carboxylesterase